MFKKHGLAVALAVVLPVIASSSTPALANSGFDSQRYDSNFSELDSSVSCSVQKQAALSEQNTQLQDANSQLQQRLARVEGELAELRKQGQSDKNMTVAYKKLQDEHQSLKASFADFQNTTDQYLLVCNDFKNQLDSANELNKSLKDNLTLKEQQITQLSQAANQPVVAPVQAPVNCPEPVATPAPVVAPTSCQDRVVYTNKNQPAAIPAHEYLNLDSIYRLESRKRSDAIKQARHYFPMPLQKAVYMKLLTEGFPNDQWNWTKRADAASYLVRYRPRDLTTEDLKKILGTSTNDHRNKILTHILAGAEYPMSFEGGLSLISGFYDQTDWAQDRKAEAIRLVAFYLPRGLTSDQVFQLVTGLTGKDRSKALSHLSTKIRTDFSPQQKEQLLKGFYSQTDHGKKQWNKGYDALSPEKRNFSL